MTQTLLHPRIRRDVRRCRMAVAQPDRREDGDEASLRLALSRTEAASALGVSVDFFDQHVLPELRVVRRGRRRLIAIEELRRWLDDSAFRGVDP